RPAAAMTEPVIRAARRPAVSAHLPAGNISAVWTTADDTKATPTQPGATPSESTNSSGTTALRTPSTANPTAKLAINAAWYSGVGNRDRNVGSGWSLLLSVRSVSSVPSSASPWVTNTKTTTAARVSVPAYRKNGARRDIPNTAPPSAGPV